MTNLYHNTYEDEIFQLSQCIWHENTLMDFFRSQLINFGYHSVSENHKVWQRGDHQVVVCLVDDFTTCSDRFDVQVPYLFDSNTTIITDNWVSVPTQYQVCQLPNSFYGIYSYIPKNIQWKPDRRFSFAVRRLDAKRLLLWLEMELRRTMMSENIPIDYINFNAWAWGGDNSSPEGHQQNLQQQFDLLDSESQKIYGQTFQDLLSKVPMINHELTHEQMHVSSWINVIAETYSSDTCIALSEKIFRALSLPAPWMVYGGKDTVAYLRSMGFDVMSDIINHNYDNAIELRTAAYGDKMVDFVFEGSESVERMQLQDWQVLNQRTHAAAQHNQALMSSMRRQWPTDFSRWWNELIPKLSS